jgi:hypothetical protein
VATAKKVATEIHQREKGIPIRNPSFDAHEKKGID